MWLKKGCVIETRSLVHHSIKYECLHTPYYLQHTFIYIEHCKMIECSPVRVRSPRLDSPRHTHQHQQQRHYHIKTSHTKVLSSRIILSGNPDFPLTFQVDLRKVLSRWITLSLKYVTSGIILSANFTISGVFRQKKHYVMRTHHNRCTEGFRLEIEAGTLN